MGVRRLRHEEAATAVEYAIMVTLIAAIIVLVVVVLGKQTNEAFCDTSTALESGGMSNGGPASTC